MNTKKDSLENFFRLHPVIKRIARKFLPAVVTVWLILWFMEITFRPLDAIISIAFVLDGLFLSYIYKMKIDFRIDQYEDWEHFRRNILIEIIIDFSGLFCSILCLFLK